jgi:hypothetical protein
MSVLEFSSTRRFAGGHIPERLLSQPPCGVCVSAFIQLGSVLWTELPTFMLLPYQETIPLLRSYYRHVRRYAPRLFGFSIYSMKPRNIHCRIPEKFVVAQLIKFSAICKSRSCTRARRWSVSCSFRYPDYFLITCCRRFEHSYCLHIQGKGALNMETKDFRNVSNVLHIYMVSSPKTIHYWSAVKPKIYWSKITFLYFLIIFVGKIIISFNECWTVQK